MRHEVTISFDGRDWLDLPVEAGELPSPESARRWLDEEFLRQECGPLRASGLVLTTDTILALAATVGPDGMDDLSWRRAFAGAACAALGRASVRVDVSTMTVR